MAERPTRFKIERGWYRLPRSGTPYYGPIPDGAEQIDAPTAAELDRAGDGPDLPAKNARKDDWVHAALNLGLEPGGLKRAEVIDLVEKHVQAGKHGPAVGGEVAGVDLGADSEQPGAGPGQGDQPT
jgi:hypothetical protein